MLVPEAEYGKMMEKSLLVGSTIIGERKAFKIFSTTMSGIAFQDYYDAETGFKLRTVRDQLIGGRSYTITTDYTDWRPQRLAVPAYAHRARWNWKGAWCSLKKVEVGVQCLRVSSM
ncbi:MAG: hypothetical protein R2818_10530 [Flavobacteriales bacterium]